MTKSDVWVVRKSDVGGPLGCEGKGVLRSGFKTVLRKLRIEEVEGVLTCA